MCTLAFQELFVCTFRLTSIILPFQALQYELVQYLLSLLSGTLKAVENQAATKAQIVKALKAMVRDLTHGIEVGES